MTTFNRSNDFDERKILNVWNHWNYLFHNRDLVSHSNVVKTMAMRAVKAFEELKAYYLKSPYDKDQLEMTSKTLERLKERLKETQAKQAGN